MKLIKTRAAGNFISDVRVIREEAFVVVFGQVEDLPYCS